MTSEDKDRAYGQTLDPPQKTACRAPTKDPNTGRITTCKSADHPTSKHKKEEFEANLAVLELYEQSQESPFDQQDLDG